MFFAVLQHPKNPQRSSDLFPLTPMEITRILTQMGVMGSPKDKAPKVKATFKEGDQVRVSTGPFSDFTGVVSEVDSHKGNLKVLVSIFGRETPVELEFSQVSKS